MLNTAIGLYMIVATVTGTAQTTPPMSTTNNIPTENLVQTTAAQDKKKEVSMNQAVDVEAYVKESFKDIPILADIARCESQFRQVDTNGKVIRGKENPYDIGVMQINELYHLKQAKAEGLDLYTLEGNVQYARELYEKQGVYPWMASSACWSGTGTSNVAVTTQSSA